MRGEIAKRGLYAFSKQWDNGYRQITAATKPITTPEDLSGFKIRVPPSPLWTSMFQAFGAAPTTINFNEVYSALQTHVVDGQENPLAVIDTAKLYEVQKYLSVTNHMWDGFWFLANRRAWDALPADAREIVEREMNASGLAEREDVAKLNATLQGALQAQGAASSSQTDPQAFRAALKQGGFYSRLEAEVRRGGVEHAGRRGRAASPEQPDGPPRRAEADARDRRSPPIARAAGAPAVIARDRDACCAMPSRSRRRCSCSSRSCVLLAGVVSRFVFHHPFVWSDELASILFLWLAMFGAVVALQRAEHMRLTAIVSGMRPAWRARADVLAVAVPALFLALLLPARERITRRTSGSSRRRRSGCRTSCAPPRSRSAPRSC